MHPTIVQEKREPKLKYLHQDKAKCKNVPGIFFTFDAKATKPKLYTIIKGRKPDPVYQANEILRRTGLTILRLPPYHCDLNPIELIWGDLKGVVARENSTFEVNVVHQLIKDNVAKIRNG